MANTSTLIDSSTHYMDDYAVNADLELIGDTSHFDALLYSSAGDLGTYTYTPSMQGVTAYLSPMHTPNSDLTGLEEFPLYAGKTISSIATPLSAASAASPSEDSAPVLVQSTGVCAAQGERRKEQNRSAQRAYRERQKKLIDALGSQVEALKGANAQLKAKSDRLESELMTLQREMLLHFERVHGAGFAPPGRKA